MGGNYLNNEVLNSWRRCVEMGILYSIPNPILKLDKNALATKLNESKILLSVFNESVSKIYTHITGEHAFILTDPSGVLLCIKEKMSEGCLKEGISLSEESSGTNAIALAIKHKKSFYTLPRHHYCNFFRKMYLFAIPLCIKDRILGSIAIMATGKPIKKELLLIGDLLSYQIIYRFESLIKHNIEQDYNKLDLNTRQVAILKLLANGLTEKAAAVAMGISINTIRYHKKNIFQKLNAGSIIDAIVKALKQGIISVDEF